MSLQAPYVRLEPAGVVTLYDKAGARQKMVFDHLLGRWRSIDPPELLYPCREDAYTAAADDYYDPSIPDFADDDVPF